MTDPSSSSATAIQNLLTKLMRDQLEMKARLDKVEEENRQLRKCMQTALGVATCGSLKKRMTELVEMDKHEVAASTGRNPSSTNEQQQPGSNLLQFCQNLEAACRSSGSLLKDEDEKNEIETTIHQDIKLELGGFLADAHLPAISVLKHVAHLEISSHDISFDRGVQRWLVNVGQNTSTNGLRTLHYYAKNKVIGDEGLDWMAVHWGDTLEKIEFAFSTCGVTERGLISMASKMKKLSKLTVWGMEVSKQGQATLRKYVRDVDFE